MLAAQDQDQDEGFSSLIDRAEELVRAFDPLGDTDDLFCTLDAFMEDPTILDLHLAAWFVPICSGLRAAMLASKMPQITGYLHLINHFTKICGLNRIRAYLPHETNLVKPFFNLAPQLVHHVSWEVRSITFLWASLIVLVPFKSLPKDSLMSMVEIAKGKLTIFGKEGKTAALFLSCACRRSDCDSLIDQLLHWILLNDHCSFGILQLLCNLMKDSVVKGDHEASLTKIAAKYKQLCQDTSSFKLYIRFTQYMALFFTDHLESALGLHLSSLSHRDTDIRWTAAKGIGKMSGQMGESFAQEIVDSMISVKNPAPELLQGVGLTIGQLFMYFDIAEMGKVMEFLKVCLKFEKSKGTYAIGGYVRDAACYACWSWAKYRTSKPGDMVLVIANHLLALTLFDREISVRRAACAAFQELTGRTTAVPQGIKLLESINYFTISSTKNCFENLSHSVLRMEDYRDHLMEHLVHISLPSFDKNIRVLASDTLGSFDWNPQQLKVILDYCQSDDPNLIHAGLLTVSKRLCLVNSSILFKLMELFAQVGKSNTLGYALIAESWLTLIESYSKNEYPANCMSDILSIVSTALRSRFTTLHHCCVNVLMQIRSRSPESDPQLTKFYRTAVLPGADKDPDMNAQVGYSAVIGTMPSWLFQDRAAPLTKLLVRLISTTVPINNIEKRVNLIQSVERIYSDCFISEEITSSMFDCLIRCSDDYFIDSRGDVGSLIREASLKALCSIRQHLSESQRSMIFGKILHQVLDRLDRVRWTCFDLLNMGGWPLQFPPLDRSSFPVVAEKARAFIDQYCDDIMEGWINSVGCTTPSISDPSWIHLKPIASKAVNWLLGNDRLLDPASRLCRASLGFLLKWVQDIKGDEQSSIVKVIRTKLEQHNYPLNLLFELVILLKSIACPEAKACLQDIHRTTKYPRIRLMIEKE